MPGRFERLNIRIGRFILPLTPGASANDGGTLKGVVSDKNGPLVGVAVYVKDTNNGVSSDIDGNYLLAGLEEGDVIVFSLLGFDTVEITWTGQALQDVVLDASADFLDEVVVVGYGVQKKVNLTGSVSTVDSDELDMRPVANITQSLQGLVPGLTVNNTNSGRPGAEATLQIRGQGNLSGTSTPYVLVDGVEMDLADVNPNDVESISVLKDASASAIYGARAAYGVILVTTKSGEKGKIRVSYNGNAGWTQPTVLPDMANSVEYANYWNAAATNAGSSRLYSAEKIAQLQAFINDPSSVDPWSDPYTTLNAAYENSEYGVGNTDYFDLHYKDFAFKQDHNLSVSGGSDKVRYYVSGGAYTEEGILRYADIDYTRYNIAANINADLTKWMRLKFNTKYSHQETNTPFGTGGLSEGFYQSLARFSPTKHYIDPNVNFTELSLIPYLQSGTYTNSVDDDFLFTVGLEVEPVKNWKIFADYTYKQNNWNYKALNKAPVMYEADGVTTFTGTRSEMGVLADGSFLRQMDIIRYQTLNVYTTYSHSVDKHNFTVMAGFQEEDYNYNYMYGYVTDPEDEATIDAEGKSQAPAIQFRYADALLNYAEALAELDGAGNAEKIKAALKPLRDRVGMPEVDFDREYNTSDDYPFKDLDKYIQAVRRERRVEKAFEAERKYDIFRWAAADVLIKGWVPTGALFNGSDLEGNSFYTDEDGNSSLVYDQSEGNNLFLTDADENGDRYVVPFDWKSSLLSGYQFNLGRDYLLPIRSGMISLTGNLWEQNPGW